MCNEVHKGMDHNFTEILEEGVGWKLFLTRGEEIRQFNSPTHVYHGDEDGWVCWDHSLSIWKDTSKNEEDFGFCFFLSLPVAERAARSIFKYSGVYKDEKIIIRKINYRKGLGAFDSCEMVDGMWRRMAIAKEFKIADEGR